MELILPGALWLSAHKSMLKVKKSDKITLNSQDYVLWQNQKREVFVLDNVCISRQTPLSNGCICQEINSITCPVQALDFGFQEQPIQNS